MITSLNLRIQFFDCNKFNGVEDKKLIMRRSTLICVAHTTPGIQIDILALFIAIPTFFFSLKFNAFHIFSQNQVLIFNFSPDHCEPLEILVTACQCKA